jgi:hypothetical protein
MINGELFWEVLKSELSSQHVIVYAPFVYIMDMKSRRAHVPTHTHTHTHTHTFTHTFSHTHTHTYMYFPIAF